MDILTVTYNRWLDWVAALSPVAFLLCIRGALALVVCIALCSLLFRCAIHRLPRCVLLALMWAAFLAGLFLAMEIPLDNLELGRVARGWAFAFSVFVLVTAPAGLTWFLTPIAGLRKLCLGFMYAVLVAMAVVVRFWRES